MVSTGLTRARRSQAALALDPIPHQRSTLTHKNLQSLTSTTPKNFTRLSPARLVSHAVKPQSATSDVGLFHAWRWPSSLEAQLC